MRPSSLEDELNEFRSEIDRLRIENRQIVRDIKELQNAGDAMFASLAEFNDPEDETRLLEWQRIRNGCTY